MPELSRNDCCIPRKERKIAPAIERLDFRLALRARVVKSVATRALKALAGELRHAGSNPAPGTIALPSPRTPCAFAGRGVTSNIFARLCRTFRVVFRSSAHARGAFAGIRELQCAMFRGGDVSTRLEIPAQRLRDVGSTPLLDFTQPPQVFRGETACRAIECSSHEQGQANAMPPTRCRCLRCVLRRARR